MPINSVPVRQEVTAEVGRILTNECLTLRWINHEYETYYEERAPVGTTIQIKRPWRPQTREGQGFNPGPIVQTTVPLTISYWRGGDFIFNDTDESLYLDMERFHESYSKPMGVALANQIDADFLAFMQLTTPNFVGTPGTIPTTTSAYNAAQTMLNKLLCPRMDRSIVYTSDYNQQLVGAGQTLFNPQRDIGDQYLTGYVGKYADFRFGIDEQIPTFTIGTYTGAQTVNGAGQSGSTLNLTTVNAVSLNPGDRITIAGVYKVNPNGIHTPYTGTANLFQAVVQQAVSTSGSGNYSVSIYPPLLPAGLFQNASVSPANAAVVTIQGASGSTCNTAFAFGKEAFTSAFIKLHEPENVSCAVFNGETPETRGVSIRSIRQWQSSGPYAGYETERMDVIYGIAAFYADYMAGVIYG